jgi:acetyl-CoA carboxylase biotin carboxyl carrier protein
MPELTHEDVRRILQIIDEMGDRDVHLEFGDLKLEVTRNGTPRRERLDTAEQRRKVEEAANAVTVPASESRSPAREREPQWEVPAGLVAVRAPSMGTFYRAPSPGAPPFVEVGTHVAPDDIVCVFDVMKLFNSLKAGVAGTVSEILVENQAVVQQDQPLILIKPD